MFRDMSVKHFPFITCHSCYMRSLLLNPHRPAILITFALQTAEIDQHVVWIRTIMFFMHTFVFVVILPSQSTNASVSWGELFHLFFDADINVYISCFYYRYYEMSLQLHSSTELSLVQILLQGSF